MFLDNDIIMQDLDNIYLNEHDGWGFLSNKKILITGATGMLTSYIVFFLIYLKEKKNISVEIILFIRSKEKAEMLFGEFTKKKYLKIVIGDLSKEIKLNKDIDIIIHGASLASPQYYLDNPVETLLPNVIGTYNLLEFSKKQKLNSFLFLSSGSIYGKIITKKTLSEDIGGWLDPLAIDSCYGESKRMGETMCAAWFREHGVPTKIVRIRHTFGPTLDLINDNRIIAFLIRSTLNGDEIHLKSDGSRKIQLLYISDAISGIFKILKYGNNGEAYNLSNAKQSISIISLAKSISKLVSRKNIPIVISEIDRKEKWNSYKTNTGKLNKLNWEPKITIINGLRRTLKGINII